jgi:hypothetical protein
LYLWSIAIPFFPLQLAEGEKRYRGQRALAAGQRVSAQIKDKVNKYIYQRYFKARQTA